MSWSWLATAWAGVTVLTILSAVPALDGPEPFPRAWVDVATAAAVLGIFPLLWTRRPVPVALLLAGLSALSGAATPASTIATWHVARWYSFHTALPVAVAGFAGHAVQALWHPVALPLGWWLLCDAAVHAALLGWGAYGRARDQLLWNLRDRARRAEAEQERLVAAARVAERTRIAREMHDTLAHRLSLIAATAGALEYRPDAPPERIASAAALVREGVSGALDELRDVVRVLRAPGSPDGPDRLAPQHGLDDVARLVDDARAAGQDVTFVSAREAEPPPATAVAAYRAAQEGLTNARRHAPGSPVRLRLFASPGEVRVVVSDAGASLVPAGDPGVAAGTGTGLVGLRERVGLLGGRVEAGVHDRGYVLDVRIPWGA
ncbi:histidine kinase [Cellulosimicrobium arenosum]|uniref:histidine kinase n=2 Tax=Cellulosimicrobium arenosum TaxID=2708133 RepID=A0A927G8P2_9MICO|nr:histidine kinase [Cellulosimicrobium arenosum]